MATSAFESRIAITAEDRTGKAMASAIASAEKFENVIKAVEKVLIGVSSRGPSLGNTLDRSLSAIGRHADGVQKVTRNLGQMEGVLSRIGSKLGGIGGGIGQMITAAGGTAIAGGAIHAAMTLQDQKIAMRLAGIKPETVDRYERQALALAKDNPTVTAAAIMKMQQEARSVVQHPEELDAIMPDMVAAKAVLDQIDDTHQASEGLNLLLKGAENIGAAQNPERFRGLLDRYVKALEVTGKTLNPESIFEFDKYARSAGGSLSDRFLATTALSLSQEMGGSSAGKAFAGFYKELSGGLVNLHTAAKSFASLDLIAPDDLDKTKTGEVKGLKPGRQVKGSALAMSDPDRWVYEILLPAMDAKGIIDPTARKNYISQLFPNTSVADAINKMIQQEPSYENHAKLFDAATGVDGVKILNESIAAQFNAVGSSLNDLAAVAGQDSMKTAADYLSRVANALRNFTGWAQENPNAATAGFGASVIGGGILGGFGLRGLFGGGGAVAGGVATEAGAVGGAAAGLGLVGAITLLASSAAAALGLYDVYKHSSLNDGEDDIVRRRNWETIPGYDNYMKGEYPDAISRHWKRDIESKRPMTLAEFNQAKYDHDSDFREPKNRDPATGAVIEPASSQFIKLQIDVKPSQGFFEMMIRNLSPSTGKVQLDVSGAGTAGRSFDGLVGP